MDVKKWLFMASASTEQELVLDLSNTSHLRRAKILRWLNENISNELLNDQVNILEKSIRNLQGSFRGKLSRYKEKDFNHFIKLVHAHDLITFTQIRSVLKDPETYKLNSSNLRICDKQALPLGRTLCNFTSVSKTVKPDMALPHSDQCPCRNNSFLHPCEDLADGHIITTDPSIIKDRYIFVKALPGYARA